MALTWAILGFAGVGFATTVLSGFAVGLVAEAAAHLWWQRRERRRDVANCYVRRRDEA